VKSGVLFARTTVQERLSSVGAIRKRKKGSFRRWKKNKRDVRGPGGTVDQTLPYTQFSLS